MDANALTESGWKAIVAKFKVKDNGLQKALANYANLDDEKYPERLKAIAVISQLATTLKKAKEIADQDKVLKYLTGVIAAADAERKKIEADVKAAASAKKKEEEDKQKGEGGKDKEEDEDEKLEGDYATRLTLAIQKLKSSKGLTYPCLLCEAKPVWGVTIAKKLNSKHKEELTKVTGGRHFLHPGTCQFDGSHFIFTIEEKISGLARKLQDAIKNFTGKKYPITIGTESAEEEDEKAGGAQPKKELKAEHKLSTPKPIPVEAKEGSSPHLGVDGSAAIPWSFQATLVLKDFDFKKIGDPKKLSLDLFHEPNVSLTFDSSGLSVQEAVALVNLHWIPPWQREIEVPLSAFINQAVPSGRVSGGGQVQVEQHIVDWFSITVTATGTYSNGSFGMSGNAGVLFHFKG